MPITCSEENRLLTASLSGEIDHHGAKDMMRELDRRISVALPNALILDLAGVTFMDSSGIAVLLRAWRRMGELSGSTTVRSVPSQAAKVLKTAGLERMMKFE
ncbi:MAG: STAS domain-containing protein [Oscillospiraceae bacterium]